MKSKEQSKLRAQLAQLKAHTVLAEGVTNALSSMFAAPREAAVLGELPH